MGLWGGRHGVCELLQHHEWAFGTAGFITQGCGLWLFCVFLFCFFNFTHSWQLAGGCSWPQLIVTKGPAPHGIPNQPPVEAGPFPALEGSCGLPSVYWVRSQAHEFPLGVSCLQVQRATGIGNSRNILATASDPNGFQLGISQDPRGQINFLTKETGFCCPCPCPAHLPGGWGPPGPSQQLQTCSDGQRLPEH